MNRTRKRHILAVVALSLMAGTAAALEDPTRPPAYTATSAPDETSAAPAYVLTSTLVSSGRRLAVINGKTVRSGEQLGDVRVLSIAPDHVRLQRGEEVFTLHLLSTSFKKPRSSQSGERP